MNTVDESLATLSGPPDPLLQLAGAIPSDRLVATAESIEAEEALANDDAALVEKFPSTEAFNLTAAPISINAGTIKLGVLDASDRHTKGAIEHATRMNVILETWDRARIMRRLRELYPMERRAVTHLTADSTGVELWDRVQQITMRRHAQNVFIHAVDGGGGVVRWVVDGRYDDARLATESAERPDGTLCAMRLTQTQYEMLSRRIDRQASMPEGVGFALAGIELRRDAAFAEGRVLRYQPEDGTAYFMRVVGSAKTLRPIEALGIPKDMQERWLAAIHGPMGLHAVVGPSGAGKNTTIAASLMTLPRSSLNVVSVERPRELTIPDVRQIELADGDEPREVLEAMLSCQPSLLYFTETKTRDVATVLTRAARTGNQIVTSWHSHSALDAPDSLVDLELSPRNVAASMDTVLAQRLLPRLCECHNAMPPLKLSDIVKDVLEKRRRADIIAAAEADLLFQPNPKGCAKCAYTGYNGLIGVFELLIVTPEIKRLIKAQALPDEILPVAVEQGYRPMLEAAFDYVIQGMTTLQAVSSILITGFKI